MSNNAQTDTQSIISNIEANLPEGEVIFEAKAETAPQPAPEVVPERNPNSWSSPGVSAEGAARAKEDELAAIEAGFAVAPPIYEIGSLVNQWGVDNFRASRQSYEALPTTDEACGKLVDQIKLEARRDLVIPLRDLRMLPDGRLTRGTGAGMKLDERAIGGIGAHITPGGGSYLRKCPTELRAVNFNHWAEANALKEDGRATSALINEWYENGAEGLQPSPVMIDREIKLRTRMQHVGEDQRERIGYAIVSPGYSVHDVDTIAEQVMRSDAIPADARATVTYDGFKARIDVLFHSNVQPEKVVAGEIFKAGIMVKTADDGSGSIQIAAQVWRNLCLNLIIIDHAKQMVMRRSHRGQGIGEAVEQGILQAMKKVAVFADKWSEATMEDVLAKYEARSIEDVMRGLVFNKVVVAPGCAPKAMFKRLMTAYKKEVKLAPEQRNSRSIIVNSVTRVAHDNPWSKWETVEALETLGGQLLYAPAWNIELPEDLDLTALGY